MSDLNRLVCTFLICCLLATSILSQERIDMDELNELSMVELMGINVISASKRMQKLIEAPATIYVVTEKDIEQYGYRDLKDVLQHLPGIEYGSPHTHIEGGQRGFSGSWSQTVILINGRQTNSIWSSVIYVSCQYTLSNVKQIEIIQGPASSLYGADAFTGVINIITKDSDNSQKGSQFAVTLGNIDEALDNKEVSFNVITTKKNLGITLSGTMFNQKGPDFTNFIRSGQYAEFNRQIRNEMFDSGNPYRDDDRAYNANAHLIYSMDNSKFSAGIYFLSDEDGGGMENPEIVFTNFNMILEKTVTYLEYERNFTSYPIKLTIDAFRGEEDNFIRFQNRTDVGDNPPPLGVFNIEDSKLSRINVQFDIAPESINNYLIFGFGYNELNIGEPAFTGVSSDDSTLGFPAVGRYLYPPRGYFSNLIPYLIQDKKYLFIQDQHSLLNDKLQITLGGRFDRHSIYGNITNVRSGVYFQLTKGWAIKALYGEAFREPNMFELSDNPDLKPSEMKTGELSLHFDPIRNIAGQLVFYRNRASKIIEEQRGTTGRGGMPVNMGNKTVEGLESLIRWKHNKLRGNIWYNYERNPDDDDFLDVAKNKFGFGVIYSITNYISASLQGKYTDKIKSDALDGNGENIIITVPEYESYNLTFLAKNVSFSSFPDIDLSFSIYNLFDRENLYPNLRGPNPSRYKGDGRSFFVRSEVHF